MPIEGSPGLREFIKQHEGHKAGFGSYDDVTGKKTEGYGDTLNKGAPTKTKEDAEKRLDENINMFASEIGQHITRDDLTPSQQDAILDMTFNLGTTKTLKSGIIKLINEKKDAEVYELLGEFTKAKEESTGDRVVFPGLVKRTQARQKMWGFPGVSAPQTKPSTPDEPQSTDTSDLEETMPAAEGDTSKFDELDVNDAIEGKPPALDSNSDLLDSMPGEPSGGIDNEIRRNEERLLDGRATSEGVDNGQKERAKDLASSLNIDERDADAVVTDPNFEENKIREDIKEIATKYPALTRFASRPGNYNLMASGLKGLKAIETATNPLQDLRTQGTQVVLDIQKNSMHWAMLSGAVDVDQGTAVLKKLEEESQKNPIVHYREGVNKIGKQFQDVGDQIDTNVEAIKFARQMADEDSDKLISAVWKSAKETGKSFVEILEIAEVMMDEPGAAGILMLRSMGTGLIPITTGLAGAATPVPGGALIGGFIGGAYVAFGTMIQEEMEDAGFANDPAGFYSDPERVKRVRKKAAKYAAFMGGIDGVLSKFTGGGLSKTFKGLKEARKAGKAVKAGKAATEIAKSATKDIIVRGSAEGVQESGARLLSGEDVGSSLTQGIIETALGGPTSAAHVVMNVASKPVLDKMKDKQKLKKFVSASKKAIEGLSNREKLQELTKAWNASPEAKSNPRQVGELVDETIKGESDTISPFSGEDAFVEGETGKEIREGEDQNAERFSESEALNIGNEVEARVVKLRPEEIEAYFAEQEINGFDAIAELGESFKIAYAEARAKGQDLEVPLKDFLRVFGDDEGLIDLVRLDDAELNGNEGEQNLQVLEDVHQDLFTTNDPDEGGPDFKFEEGEPGADDPVLRPVELQSRFRNEGEKKVLNKLQADIRKATGKNITKEMTELAAELQFRHVRFRQEVLGIDGTLAEMASDIKIRGKKIAALPGAMGNVEYRTPKDMVLNMREDATAKTLMHEFAHTWLYDMSFDWSQLKDIEDSKLNERQREYKEVIQDAAELLGFKDMSEFTNLDPRRPDSGAIFNRAHETFAQTAEKYFLEGKFKNTRVRRVMEMIRKWMKPLASIIGKSYPHWPPLKISNKVERVFATILDISNTSDEAVFNLFPEPIFDPDQLGKDGAKYLAAIKEARDQAIAESYNKSFTKSLKEREKAVDEVLDSIFDRATAEVDARDSMTLAAALQAVAPEARITDRSFIDLFGTVSKASIPKSILAGQKRKGRDIFEVLGELGLENNPEKFLEMLQEASLRDELIEKTANAIVDAEFPSMKSDEEIHKIAVEAVQSEGRRKLLNREMKLLATKHLNALKQITKAAILPPQMQRRMVKEKVNAEAFSLVFSAPIKGFKATKFLTQSQRYGRDAAKAFGKNDLEEALNAKQREILYFEAFNVASAIQKEMGKATIQMKRVLKSRVENIARAYDVEGYNTAKAIAIAFASGKELPLIDVNNLPESLSDVYNDEWADELNLTIGRINQSLRAQGVSTAVDVQTYLEIADVIGRIRAASYHAKNIEIGELAMFRDEMNAKIVEEIGEVKPGDPKKEGNLLGPKKWFRSYTRSLGRFRETLSSLYKDDISFSKSTLAQLFNMFSEAEANFTRDKENSSTKLGEILRARTKARKPSPWKAITRRLKDPSESVHSKELGVTFESVEQVLVMMLHLGSQSGTEKVLMGGIEKGKPLANFDFETGQIDDTKAWEFVNRLIEEGSIIKEDLDALQSIWDSFEEHYAGANDAHRRIKGFNFGKIEGKAFTTKHGTYRGGYYPAIQNAAYADVGPGFDSLIVDGGARDFSPLFPDSKMGFTKSRQRVFNPLDLSLKSLPGAMHSVLQLKHLKAPMYEIGKVFSNEDVQNALEARRPGAMNDVVKPWFKRSMDQQYSNSTPEDRVILEWANIAARVVRKNARRLWFLGNVTSGLKQFLGIIQASSKVDWKYLAPAVKKTMLNPIETKRSIIELSNRMAVRMDGNQKRLIKSFDDLDLNGDWISVTDEKIDSATFFIIQHSQNLVDTSVWMAAFEQGTAKGLNNTQSAAFADNTVEQTQATSMIGSRSGIQQTSELTRLITDFSTVPLAQFHQSLEVYRRNMDEETFIRFRRQVGVAFATVLLPSLIIGASGLAVGKGIRSFAGKDDEEEENRDSLVLDMASEALDVAFPVVGRHAGSIVKSLSKTIGKRFFDSKTGGPGGINLSPALSTLDSFDRAKRGLIDEASGVDMLPSDLAALFDAFTLATGIPLSPIARGIRLGVKLETIKEKRKRKRNRGRQLKKARNAAKRRARQ